MKNANVISTGTMTKVNALIEELNKLSDTYETFKSSDLNNTHQKLYQILTTVYEKYEEAAASLDVLRRSVSEIRDKLKNKEIFVQKNSTAISLFVKYVFSESERNTIFNYTKALQAAKSRGIRPCDFVNFVYESGGIEGCKALIKMSSKASEKHNQIATSMPLVEDLLSDDGGTALARFKVNREMVDLIKDKKLVHLVGTCDAEGNISVRAVVPGYSRGFSSWAKRKLAECVQLQNSDASLVAGSTMTEAEAAMDKASAMLAKVSSGTLTIGELG